jgi:hypothetical protein
MSSNRLPIIKKESEDFKLTYAGEEYIPHAGEAVWFVPYLSTAKTLALLEATDKLDEESGSDVVKLLNDQIAPILVEVISHWTWTSPVTGEPLGKVAGSKIYRPDVEAIRSLSLDEMSYLVGAYFETRGGDEDKEENPQ